MKYRGIYSEKEGLTLKFRATETARLGTQPGWGHRGGAAGWVMLWGSIHLA